MLIETKLSYEKLRWQRVSSDVFVAFLTKDMLQLLELNFGCHREFRVRYLGRVGVISINVDQR